MTQEESEEKVKEERRKVGDKGRTPYSHTIKDLDHLTIPGSDAPNGNT